MLGATLLNRYRIDAELGRGGMGVVYRAHDTLLDRDVAVKVLSEAGLGTEGRARLLREAQAAAKLDHPNIVAVHDVDEAEDIPFIVMQLVEGESLHSRGFASLDEIMAIASQVCAALDHAHAHGIIHRDLKPENVIITPDGLAKLMDFGLARSTASRLTSEGVLVGTVFYLAPEQALGQAIDGRADLYSFGVVLYELVAGRLPFTGDNPLAVISQHLYAPVVPPSTYNPEIPPALDALLLKLLAKDPAARFASAAEARQALESLDSGSTAVQAAVEVSPIDRIARGRLVARERELTEATAHWRRAVSGEGSVLLISGEPGIGKTRLVRELVTQARITGAQALIGECYAEGGAPYAPIAQIIQSSNLQSLISNFPPLVLADLLTLAPNLRVQFPDAPPNPPLDPQAEQRRLFESVVMACAALAERQPLLLVIDDAHWADSGTLFLLRHLARRVIRAKHPQSSPLRMLIVLTYREVELDEARALNDVLADLNRERLAERIKLARLTPDQTRDLLAAIFQEEITPEFLADIYRETEGNPFFVEEVCKALIEEGKVYREGDHWGRLAMSEMRVPQSVRVAIETRVGKLPESIQETLRLAAVVGRKFDFETLLTAAEQQNEEALVTALEQAERGQLIAEVDRAGGGTFAFTHALIPATLAEGVSGLRRRRLHKRAATAIERLRPDDFEALAHHYSEAADDEQARAYYARAGDRALATYANVEAEKHYRAALELGGSAAERAHSFAGLGEAASRQARHDEAIQTWREAIHLYQSLGDYDGVARLYARSARAAGDGNNTPRGLTLGREGLSMVAGQPASFGIAALLHETARACYFNGLPDEALPLCRDALAMAERVGDVQVQAEALTTLALLLTLSNKEGLAALTQAIELAEAAGLLKTAARAHNNLAHGLVYAVGDLWTAHGHWQRAAALARQMGLADELLYSARVALALLWLADFAAVEERLTTVRKVWSALPQPDSLDASALKLTEGFLLRCRGDLDEAEPRLRADRVELRQQGNLQFLWFTNTLLAEVLFETSEAYGPAWRWEEVEEVLAEALTLDDRGVGASAAWLRGLLIVARLRQSRLEEARHLLAEARVKAGSDPGAWDEEHLSLAEARLALAEARWPEALAAFEAAANLEARMGKRWYRAQTLREWAEAHLARGGLGDRERARELLQESLALFEVMNVPKYAAIVKESLASL